MPRHKLTLILPKPILKCFGLSSLCDICSICVILSLDRTFRQIASLCLRDLSFCTMFNSPAWHQPNNPRTEPRSARFDLRDRIKQYAPDNTSTSSPCPDDPSLSPTDAFFAGPSPLVAQVTAQKPAAAPPLKHRQVGQREPEKPQSPQEYRPVLAELQASASPIVKELNGASPESLPRPPNLVPPRLTQSMQ